MIEVDHMTKDTHTPGPWEWDDAKGPALGIDGNVKSTVGVWAQVRYDAADDLDDEEYDPEDEKWVCGVWGTCSKEDIANARLIAAAPDLLDVLQEILDATAYDHGGPNDLYAKAEKIIAKARGQS